MQIKKCEGEKIPLEQVAKGAVIQHPNDRETYYMVINLPNYLAENPVKNEKGEFLIHVVNIETGRYTNLNGKSPVLIAQGYFQITQLGVF